MDQVYSSKFDYARGPPPDDVSVWEYLWENPNNVPDDQICLSDQFGNELTRSQLYRTSLHLASSLRYRFSLQPGEKVLLFSPNSIHYHPIVFAIQALCCTISPANQAYTPEELAHQWGDSGAKAVIVGGGKEHLETALRAFRLLPRTTSPNPTTPPIILAHSTQTSNKSSSSFPLYFPPELLQQYPTTGQFVEEADKREREGGEVFQPVKMRDLGGKGEGAKRVAFLAYSSGTTGKAKGVMTSHHNLISVLALLDPFSLGAYDVQVGILPFSHIYALSKSVHWPIREGMKVVIMSRWDLETFSALVQAHRATFTLLVPPIALQLAKDPRVENYDFSSMKLIVSGAAPLGSDLEQALAKRIGCDVGQAYGLTETSPTTHFCPPSNPMPGSIGFLLAGLQARIVDPQTLKNLPQGEEGELWLKGPNIMMGYLNRPDATKETVVQGGWLRTGDIGLVRTTKDGDFFFITDRMKELIKYKGHQVAPAELEGLLVTHPDVLDAGVVGVYDEAQVTELPRAFVVLDPAKVGTNGKEAERQIQTWLDQKVAPHKRLRGGVRLVSEIPKSPSGKILRRVLRDQAKEEGVAPRPKL